MAPVEFMCALVPSRHAGHVWMLVPKCRLRTSGDATQPTSSGRTAFDISGAVGGDRCLSGTQHIGQGIEAGKEAYVLSVSNCYTYINIQILPKYRLRHVRLHTCYGPRTQQYASLHQIL